mmetsp:Transcript_963/g.1480  ORF Transcript_963/g.1480 Transcript_963/m.1480 type:complete len:576 (-) Transcript_963:2587-4314(-)
MGTSATSRFVKSATLLLFISGSCCCYTPSFSWQAFPRTSKPEYAFRPKTKVFKFSEKLTRHKMLSSETIMEKIPSKTVIDAIENFPNGKVIASDVAASAGISLSQARKDLTTLASLTQGDIAVSSDGELIYSFPKNINGVLSSNSAKYRVLENFNKIKPVLFYFVRISFGVVLIASIFAIFSTIFFISSSSSSDDRDDDRGFRGGGSRGLGGGMGYWWGPSPFDFFYYRPYYGYYGSLPEDRRDPEEMGFLESTFSYIFGDGNPNERLEEKRLRLASNMIRRSNGAVTAEQLALFCDDTPEPEIVESASYVDERFVLPIVTQLNGEPRVTEEGNIIYVFPELQLSASSASIAKGVNTSTKILARAGLSSDATSGEIKTLLQLNGISARGAVEKRDLIDILEKVLPASEEDDNQDAELLEEKKYEFSLAPSGTRFLAGGLGVVNILGALYLGGQLSYYASYGIKLPALFGVVQSCYPLLLGYAVLYNVIPLVRSFWIKRKNALIQKRNERRRLWRTTLKSAVGNLAGKLLSAKRYGSKMQQLGSNDIIFDTGKPLDELERKKEQDAMDEFDKLLED